MANAIEAINAIEQHIRVGDNFLLSGGAGSGKTYSLMRVLDKIFQANPKASVACITYTNVAVDEIKSRSPYQNLWVSTIHEFLWDGIRSFQKNLKTSLVELIDSQKVKYEGELAITLELLAQKKIQYKEYRKFEDGVIWHDDVLKLADFLYAKYPTLCKILCDRYDYILIDEYQDTDKQLIEMLLNYAQKVEGRKSIVGFFGDSMQSIYSGKIGNIKAYVDSGLVKEVVKEDNRRCSICVIELLNKIRSDMRQAPAHKNVQGTLKFLYSTKPNITASEVKNHETFKNWKFDDFKRTKELYLTHRLISKEKNFEKIYQLYSSNSDRLLRAENLDKLITHTFKIQELIYLYDTRKYNEFMKKTDFKVRKLEDKKQLKGKIDQLKSSENKTISDLIELAHELQLVSKDDNFESFISNNEAHYNAVKVLPYEQIKNVYEYVNDLTPFSTQHNVKGTEFDNVFVVLDNGNWNLYNFTYLFEATSGKEGVIDRTRKIFYVCCSRAKENLVVFFHKPTPKVLSQAQEWFGKDNVISIDDAE